MKSRNPTPISIGMPCAFAGRQYRVAGRVVMGMEEGGETYCWNEFHLIGADGNCATLVHEETEGGVQWRLFTLLPLPSGPPMTVQEAAAQRVGGHITLGAKRMRVTLVDESRVCHIEGEAPEGVELGDVARYFNAEAGREMVVVSWTGEEVEFYRGLDVDAGVVAAAFGMEAGMLERRVGWHSAFSGGASASASAGAGWVPKVVVIFLMVVIGFLAYTSCRPRRHEPVGRMILAPAPPLPPSGSGAFDGKSYRVRMHAITALAQVGLQYERHEYYLTDDAGNTVLVVCGLRPGANQWAWLAPIEPAGLLTPYRAATKRQGDKIEVDGVQAVVADLFRTTIRRVESPEKSELITGAVSYGFTAQHGQNLYLARWDHTNMALLRGKMVSGKEVAAAFAQRAREQ